MKLLFLVRNKHNTMKYCGLYLFYGDFLDNGMTNHVRIIMSMHKCTVSLKVQLVNFRFVYKLVDMVGCLYCPDKSQAFSDVVIELGGTQILETVRYFKYHSINNYYGI